MAEDATYERLVYYLLGLATTLQPLSGGRCGTPPASSLNCIPMNVAIFTATREKGKKPHQWPEHCHNRSTFQKLWK